MKTRERRLGWVPDIPDHRDFRYSAPITSSLPISVNLRNSKLGVFDQYTIGSCTSQAIIMHHMFNQYKQTKRFMVGSRLFHYYNERVILGTQNEDSGAMIRDGIKSLCKEGVCKESMWGYDISKLTTKPSEECYKEALNHQALQYMRVNQTQSQLCGCLASGFPFVFGFSVYESFMSDLMAKTGIARMPKCREECYGGHAVLCCGYNLLQKRFLVQNSWGTNWGLPLMKGFFTIPFDYVTDNSLADDFWTIRLVEV